jgi:MOSC domain-containing protein
LHKHVAVSALHFYPVKSCAGTALQQAEIGPRGIAHDREFMVVGADHRFLTQRELPRLALIGPKLSTFLHAHVRLVRMPDDAIRTLDPVYAPRPTDQVGFADGYPVLLISEESLADLNARMPTPLPMNRFRPHVVVAGWNAPYGEDTWAEVRIDQVQFDVVKACPRCVTTTTDQSTGERRVEPLATLAAYRRVPRGVLFGHNLVNAEEGTISVGDTVTVLR